MREARPHIIAFNATGAVVERMTALRQRLALWRMRRATRRRLRQDLPRLDERLLRDIGVSRRELYREAYRPFWKP